MNSIFRSKLTPFYVINLYLFMSKMKPFVSKKSSLFKAKKHPFYSLYLTPTKFLSNTFGFIVKTFGFVGAKKGMTFGLKKRYA